MNIMTPQNLDIAEGDAPATENPALKRLMNQWEQKVSKNAKRAGRMGGLGMVAVSLAACNDSDNDSVADDGDTTPVEEGGTWSLIAGGVKLADDFNPDIFDGGAIPPQLIIGDPSVLTPTTQSQVRGEGSPADGDDTVLATTGSLNGAEIDLGGGDDTVFINVDGSSDLVPGTATGSVTLPGLVTNVETIEIANGGPIAAGSTVNLSTVVDVEKVVISEAGAAGALQVSNVRDPAEIEMQGNFNNSVSIDFLNAGESLNLTLNDYFQNGGQLNIAQDFATINLTSGGEGTLNSIDAGALSGSNVTNLRSLTIDGTVDFEVGGTVNFRPNTQAEIKAGEFEGETLTLAVSGHNDVMFKGSAENDALSVTTAAATAGPDSEIKLTAEFGAGDNTLTVNQGISGIPGNPGYVTPDSSITSDGDLELVIGANSYIGMSQPDADGNMLDLSAVNKVVIQQGSMLNLSAEQVDQIEIENFETPDFGNATGALNIVGVDGDPLKLGDIDAGTVVSLTTAPGEVTLSPDTVLGNANAGVAAVIVDNRGEDSTVTMAADQFQQLGGTGTVLPISDTGITEGTNNPATGEPYTTGLVLTGLDEDTSYDLNNVATDTTDIRLEDFTAGSDFDITNIAGSDVTVTLAGDVDLTEAGGFNVDKLVFTDGATLTSPNLPAYDEIVFEGAATINTSNNFVGLNTDDIVGDASQLVINFTGTGNAQFAAAGSDDLTLKAVNAGPDVTGPVVVTNNLDAGATLDITGGSPAMTLGDDVETLTVNANDDNTTLIGTDADEPDIVSDTLTAINTNTFGFDEAIINLGALSVTSSELAVTGAGDGTTTVEVDEIPAGAEWEFTGVELVVNDTDDFGAGATIKLGAGTTLAGDAAIADVAPFLTSDSVVPLDAETSATDIDTLLQSLQADQATVDVTDMNFDQLKAVIDNSGKVDETNGDLVLSSDLNKFQINTLSGLYDQGADDVLTINADGMNTDQKAASGAAIGVNETDVTNLTLDSDDSVATIGQLLPETSNNSTTVEADGMGAGQLNALVAEMPNVQVINDMTLTGGNNETQITALLSKAAPTSVTVDAGGMNTDQFAAIEQQITKVDTVENLTVTAGSPAQDFQADALLDLAVDANVDASGMSDDRLSIVADKIANIEDDGISNLTVTADQTVDEIPALMGKAPDGSVVVDLSDMAPDQVTAVVDTSDKVANVSVGQNSAVSLTLTEINDLGDAGLTPILGDAAVSATDDGGSITIVAGSDGTLDLSQVAAGASSAPGDDNGGTLTLQVDDGVNLSLEGMLQGQNENLSVTGGGTLIVTEDLDLTGQDLSIGSDVTIELAAVAAPGVTLDLTAEQADTLADDGVSIDKADASGGPEVEGQIKAFGGDNTTASDPQDLSGLDLNLVDVLVLEDSDGTILPSSVDNLPAQVGVDDGSTTPPVLVTQDTDWGDYSGNFAQDVDVASDATVTLSADTVTQMGDNSGGGSSVTGQVASVDGEDGGSIIVTGLENGEVYDLSGVVTAGANGGFPNSDAGTFEISISSDVTLESGTTLPTPGDADITIDSAATLTVNGGEAIQADNSYEGTGTLEFIDLNGSNVTATDEVRYNTFTFEDGDSNATISGFEAIGLGGFDGSFSFDDTTTPDTTGLMSLDLSSFTTSGTDFDTIPNGSTAEDLDGDSVVLVDDGTDPTGTDFSGANNGEDSQLFFASETTTGGVTDTEVQYWDDAGGNGDGTVDSGELSLVATLEDTGTDQLGSDNFAT